MKDYKITFYKHRAPEPIIYTKDRLVNARHQVEKCMMSLKLGEKIIIERKEK